VSTIRVIGGKPLHGTVSVGGAKNASLPIITACLLIRGKTKLINIPEIGDIKTMLAGLSEMGVKITQGEEPGSYYIDASGEIKHHANFKGVSQIRGSQTLLGAILARNGKVILPPLGGCKIGSRQMDLHINGLSMLGAKVTYEGSDIHMETNGLKGTQVYLDYSSVGATENMILAACLAEGNTVLENAAQEPEIVDLINFLNKAGAKISGLGSKTIRIVGVSELKPNLYHRIMPDRIEAGTYMIASAITGGDVIVDKMSISDVGSLIYKLREIGAEISVTGQDQARIRMSGKASPFQIKTMPYPGFPTDLQSQMLALSCLANGISVIVENVFDSRFQVVTELQKMGANIVVDQKTATITGVNTLKPAEVYCPDLRGGAALLLAALTCPGETIVHDIEKVDRGYEHLIQKFNSIGANLMEVEEKNDAN
jgi:UDP-N-acetylglucosamine 1-carboxyvinyltransferase